MATQGTRQVTLETTYVAIMAYLPIIYVHPNVIVDASKLDASGASGVL